MSRPFSKWDKVYLTSAEGVVLKGECEGGDWEIYSCLSTAEY